jgi:hypothetical protein
VRSTADSPARPPEQRKNQANHQQDEADRPQDRDAGHKADNEKYETKYYQPNPPGS